MSPGECRLSFGRVPDAFISRSADYSYDDHKHTVNKFLPIRENIFAYGLLPCASYCLEQIYFDLMYLLFVIQTQVLKRPRCSTVGQQERAFTDLFAS